MTQNGEDRKKKKGRGCFTFFGWSALLVTGLLLVILFLIGSLFDLGLWEEFWDLFR